MNQSSMNQSSIHPKITTFLFINFMVGFMSDIILNDAATMLPHITTFSSLKPYFKGKGIFEAAFYAGLTILIAIVILSFLTKYVFNFYVPHSLTELGKTIVVAYPLGYILDYGIEKTRIFGKSLDLFYATVGSGHSGAIAFIISIVLSYNIQKYIVPLL